MIYTAPKLDVLMPATVMQTASAWLRNGTEMFSYRFAGIQDGCYQDHGKPG